MRSSPTLSVLLAALALAAPAAAAASSEWSIPPDGASHPASSWPHATRFEMLDFTLYGDGRPPSRIAVATDPALHDVVATYDTAPLAGLGEVVSARTTPATSGSARPACTTGRRATSPSRPCGSPARASRPPLRPLRPRSSTARPPTGQTPA